MSELEKVWVVENGSTLLPGWLKYDTERSRVRVVDASGATIVESPSGDEAQIPRNVYRSRAEARSRALAWLRLEAGLQEERVADLQKELGAAQKKLTDLRDEVSRLEVEEWAEFE